MEVAVAVGAGVVLVVVVSLLVRGRSRGERESVAGYREALDVLGQVAGSERGRGRHALSGPGPPAAAPYEHRREVPIVRFDDFGVVVDEGREPPEPPQMQARPDRSLRVMQRPARRFGTPLAALVVIVVAAGAVYLVVRGDHDHPPTHPRDRGAAAHSHHHIPPTTKTTSRAQKKRTRSTTTTAPPRYTPVSSTGSSATYAPATTDYSLTVGATTADCWMSVTASGTTVLEQTFTPGASSTLPITGPATILIGAPSAATLSIDGVPVVLPTGVLGPFTVTLTPS